MVYVFGNCYGRVAMFVPSNRSSVKVNGLHGEFVVNIEEVNYELVHLVARMAFHPQQGRLYS
jgi:hypothetical protein